MSGGEIGAALGAIGKGAKVAGSAALKGGKFAAKALPALGQAGGLIGRDTPDPMTSGVQAAQSMGGGLLGGDVADEMAALANSIDNNFGSNLNPAEVAPQEPETPLATDRFGSVLDAEITDPSEIFAEEEPQANFFTDLFGSLDASLASPAKQIGIGLLNQRNPGLGTGLLAAGGLYSALRKRRDRRRDG